MDFKKYIFIITSIIILSCINPKKKDSENRETEKKELRAFFDSDKIEHYYLNISEDDFFKLIRKDKKTKKELEFSELFVGNYPDTIPTADFEQILLKHNYKKSKLNIKQQKSIESVFSEKDLPIPDAAACIAEYRDIFIFKKRGKIIGISKICFKCNRFQITGSKIDVSIFGFFDELDKLKKTVRPENYSILLTE
jgi:hypothetical protein